MQLHFIKVSKHSILLIESTDFTLLAKQISFENQFPET